MTYTNLRPERAVELGDQIEHRVKMMTENGDRPVSVEVRNGVTGVTSAGIETEMTEFRVTGHVYLQPTALFDLLEDGEHFSHITTHIAEETTNIEVVKEEGPTDSLFV